MQGETISEEVWVHADKVLAVVHLVSNVHEGPFKL